MEFLEKPQYVITTGPGGIHWISLEPLLADVKKAMSDERAKADPVVFHHLETVKAFVDALISEGLQADWKDELDKKFQDAEE